MSMYKYIRETWSKPKQNLGAFYRERLRVWRNQPATVRIERPTRLDRARSLGYKAKQGFVMVRQRVRRGGRMRPKFKSGRRSKARRRKKVLDQNFRTISEQRAQREFTNLEVLNSYYVGRDKNYVWYEIIMVDPHHPVIVKHKPWLKKARKRALRGKTSAARKSRGLRNRGLGAEKVR